MVLFVPESLFNDILIQNFVLALGGVILGVVTYFNSIARHDTKQSSALFEVLAEVVPIPFAITDIQGEILFCNEKLEALLEADLSRSKMATFFSNPKTFQRLSDLVTKGRPVQGRLFQMRKANGVDFFVELSAEPSEYRRRGAIVFTLIDQTERMAASESIRSSEEQYRSIFENSLLGIMTFALDGKLVTFNRSCELIFGRQASEVEGSGVQLLIPEFSKLAIDDLTNKMQIDGHSITRAVELEAVHKNGRVLPIEVSLANFFSSGDPMVVAMVQDVSLRKQAEKEFLRNAKMATIGEVSAGIVHEINNPLTVIGGIGQRLQKLAQQHELSDEHVAEMAGKIQAMNDRIVNIIRSLRALSHMGENQPKRQADIRDLLKDCRELTEKRCMSRGIELRIGCDGDDFTAMCRGSEISQVIVNLINNAADAVKGQPRPWIQVTALDQGKDIKIKVVDSGEGIPPEIQEKMMQAFFTTKPEGVGTGLGLSLSKKILDGHNGDLMLDQGAKNTTFVVTLPKEAMEESEKAA